MRTTITLDPDLDAALRRLAQERGISFKEAVNTALRQGLAGDRPQRRAFRVKPRRLGARAGVDLTHALRLADGLEDAEIARKLELRK